MKIRQWTRRATALALIGIVSAAAAVAQPTPTSGTSRSPLSPPPNGPRRTDPATGWHVLTNATVHVKPGTVLERATVVVHDGLIESVLEASDQGYQPPAGAHVRDGLGMHVYAGFIEPFVEVEVPRPDPSAPGTHWNPRVMPQRGALDKGAKGIDEKTAQTLRSMGFTAAAIVPKGGLIRGTSALVSLAAASADPSDAQPRVYADRVYQAMSLDAGDGFGSDRQDDARWVRYPDSQMGAIALVRQTLMDADWQARAREAGAVTEPAGALDAIAPSLKTPLLFDTRDELEAIRSLTIAKEFSRGAMVLGSGREYRRLEALLAFKPQMIVPLNFPPRPRVGTIGEAESVELETMMDWEQAPTNARRLDAAGLAIALTSSEIPDKLGGRGAFKDRLALSIKAGLSADKALAMLTTNTAALLGVSDRMGTIENGKVASLVVADGPLFIDRPDAPKPGDDGYVKPGRIIDVWIDGRRHSMGNLSKYLEGAWDVIITPAPRAGLNVRLVFQIDQNNQVTVVKTSEADGKRTRATSKARDVSFDDDGRVSFVFDHDPFGEKGVFVLNGMMERAPNPGGDLVMRGEAVRAGGERFVWVARRPEGPFRPEDIKEFKPSPGSLSGVWTRVLKDGPARADDPGQTSFEIKSDKGVIVKQGANELNVKDVRWEEAGEEGEKATAKVTFAVVGMTEGQAGKGEATKVTLTPTADRNRMSLSTDPEGKETFKLARVILTPESDDLRQIPQELGLPFGPYALGEVPPQQSIIIKNATVWTCTPDGILDKGFVAIQGGKIVYVGATAPQLQGEWTEIDATGKHVTPGIIDCHSHTGISRGVNESGQAVTAEVRIQDVTDPDSISWYRQLGGGVTTVNSLHGSANPIGGQNCVNKNRWGCISPQDMHFEGAIPGIKFALGENVKQSNWGNQATTRYPQTRMGVETLIRDRFTAAREYLAAQKAAKAEGEKALPVRRDLELEALGEILEGKRLVHCHSYRQDEILMLARVAKDFGFTIGTYQHILEGYKVAEALRESSLGASAFSDWWAYKVEVQDAIPQAGPIMFEEGVVVSYNSDSDEMARRLNVEAGKALKYAAKVPGSGEAPSGVPVLTPQDALNFVTLNPARQLKIDNRVGSLKKDLDADVVIWSGPPMSPMTRAEQTFVDGRLMFSLARDAELRRSNTRERTRLIQKILAQEKREKGGGNTTSETKPIETSPPPTPAASPSPTAPPFDDSMTIADLIDARSGAGTGGRRLLIAESLNQAVNARRELYLNMLRRNIDPRWSRAGECGCEW